ncbi:MAG: hypothetical protein ABIV47_19720, partial [Roseiflexaceae bacterium]
MPAEASIEIEPVGLVAAQVGSATLVPDATIAQAEQPAPTAPAAQPRAKRSRITTPKQKQPAKAPRGEQG